MFVTILDKQRSARPLYTEKNPTSQPATISIGQNSYLLLRGKNRKFQEERVPQIAGVKMRDYP